MTARDVILSGAAVLAALTVLLILVLLSGGVYPPAVDVGGPGWATSPLQEMWGSR